MKLHRSFGPAKLGPIKHLLTQVDGRRIHADQFVFKTKRFFANPLATTPIEELKKYPLIKLPGTMLVGVPQSGMPGSRDTQVFQFPFAASKTSGNLPERMSAAQLAKLHGDKLSPTRKSFGAPFGTGFVHQVLELDPRKQL